MSNDINLRTVSNLQTGSAYQAAWSDLSQQQMANIAQSQVWSAPVTSQGITAVYNIGAGGSGGGALAAAQAQQQAERQWVIAGKSMTFEEFTQELFPDHTPGRTRFLLKYTGDPK